MSSTDPGRWDPLGHGIRLEHRRVFYPLGFPLEAASNDARALKLTARAFPLGEALFPDAPPMSLRVIVGDGEPCAVPPVYRATGGALSLAADSSHVLAADMDAGRAALWISSATMDDAAHFVRWWLAGPILQMLSHRAVTPVHAACVAREGRGLLLCGPSGAGKSVLAWAAAKAGLSFVSDDVSYLLRSDPMCALGRPNLLRLKPSAEVLIQGLDRFGPVADDEPEARIYELDPAHELGFETASRCRLAGAVLLERDGTSSARLESISGAELADFLSSTLPQADHAVMSQQLANLRSLANLPGHRLSYSSPMEAIAALDATLSSDR